MAEVLNLSFFDDAEDKSFRPGFHMKAKKLLTSEIPPPDPNGKLLEGVLYKKGSTIPILKSRFYELYSDRLLYFSVKKLSGVLFLQYARLEVTAPKENDKKRRFSLTFYAEKQRYTIYGYGDDVYEVWVEKLKSICVLTDITQKYINDIKIGEGNFAKVYVIRRKTDNEQFAAKVFIKREIKKSNSLFKSKKGVVREISMLRRLNHPNILKLNEVYENEHCVLLITDYYKYGHLMNYIKQEHLTEGEIKRIIETLAEILVYFEKNNIIHRDIKPHNILVRGINPIDVVLADFGLATDLTIKDDYFFKKCGTPGFVAPEIINEMPFDISADIFSLGTVFYALITKKSPFKALEFKDIVEKNSICDVDYECCYFERKVSEKGIDLMKMMLQKDKEKRIKASKIMQHPWFSENNPSNGTEEDLGNYITKSFNSSPKRDLSKIKAEGQMNLNNSPMIRGLHMDKPPGESGISRMSNRVLNKAGSGNEDPKMNGAKNTDSSVTNLEESEKPSTKMSMLQTPDFFKAARIRSLNTPEIRSTMMTPRDSPEHDRRMNIDSLVKKPDENKPPAMSNLKNGKVVNPNLIRNNLKKIID